MKLKSGVVGEVIDNCVRLYTNDEQQFPIIEIYARLDENGNCIDGDLAIMKMAEEICEVNFNLQPYNP